MEALKNLPITIIEPDQMKELVADKHNEKHKYTIYVVPLTTKDLVRNEEDFD